ncbi:MAG: hypothetical protein U0W24_18530 [Bacteroidales bacterium]
MKQFEFTTATKEEISSKLDVYKVLQSLLNENLRISDYSEIFKSLLIVFQCFPENSPFFSAMDYKIIRRKTSIIELYSILKYDEIISADEVKIKSMMSEAFLNSIKLHLEINSFNQSQFYLDVQKLLEPFIPKKQDK